MKALILLSFLSLLFGCGFVGIAGYGDAIGIPLILIIIIVGLAGYGLYKIFKK